MTEPEKKLAIIRRPRVCYEDHADATVVSFETYVDEHKAASQWVAVDDDRFPSLWEAMQGDVKNLEGKTCWVDVSRHNLILFMDVADFG